MRKIIFSPVYLEHPVHTSLFFISIVFLVFIQESFLLTAILLGYLVYYSFIYGDRILRETHFETAAPQPASSPIAATPVQAISEAVASPVSKSESVEPAAEEETVQAIHEEAATAPAKTKRSRKKA